MATNTPNINLVLPIGSEKVSRQVINDNNTKIDTAIGAVPSGTDLQSQVTALNNNITTLNNKMFPSGEGTNVLTATDFNTMVEIKNYFISTNSVAAACANRPCNTAGKLCVWTINGNSFDQTWQYGGQIYYAIDGKEYRRTVGTNGSKQLSFGSWQELALKSDIATTVSYLDSNNHTRVSRSGNVVTLTFWWTTSTELSAITLDSAIRPKFTEYVSVFRLVGSTYTPTLMSVSDAGKIGLMNSTGGTPSDYSNVFGMITYVCNG